MSLAVMPALLLALTLIAVFVVRSRPLSVKIACEAVLLAVIGGYLLYRGTTPLPMDNQIGAAPDGVWLRALAVLWWLIGARFVAILTVMALGRDARSRQARLFSDLLAGAIYLTAVLVILNSVLDVPVRGLLATSGVIAIVLGLALQNTLADVFSGIAVGVEQPFHVGDRVSIGDHPEGVVVEMNWRSVRIQTDGEDLATIPNSIVAKSQIINRSVPTARRAATVEIPTQSAARSEVLMNLIWQAIQLSPAILDQPTPSVSIKYVGVRTTTFGVTYFVASTSALSTARSQLLRQVRRLFRHANVQDGPPGTDASLLAGLILFESLNMEQIGKLADALVPSALSVGETIFEQGSRGASLYVIRSGILEVTRLEKNGSRTVYGRIGPGEYLGEISMMTGEARTVTVTALSPAEVLELPRSAIESLLGEDSSLSAALERSVQRGLALLDRDAAARNCQPLDEAGALLDRIRIFLGLRKK